EGAGVGGGGVGDAEVPGAGAVDGAGVDGVGRGHVGGLVGGVRGLQVEHGAVGRNQVEAQVAPVGVGDRHGDGGRGGGLAGAGDGGLGGNGGLVGDGAGEPV